MEAITRKVHVKWDANNFPIVQDELLLEHLCTFGDLCDFDRPKYKKQMQAKVAFCSVIYSITEQAQACLDAKKHELRDGTILEVRPSEYQVDEEEMVDILHHQITASRIAAPQIVTPRIAAPKIATPGPEMEENKVARTRKIHVKWNPKNLPQFTDEHLLEHFAFFGNLIHFERPLDKKKQKVPFCTVIFSTLEEAQGCLDYTAHKLQVGAVLTLKSSSYKGGEENMSRVMCHQKTSDESEWNRMEAEGTYSQMTEPIREEPIREEPIREEPFREEPIMEEPIREEPIREMMENDTSVDLQERNETNRKEEVYFQATEQETEEKRMGASTRKLHVKWNAKNLPEVTDEHLVKYFTFFGDIIHFVRPQNKKKEKVPFCSVIFNRLEEAQSCLDLAVHSLEMGAVLKLASASYDRGEEELYEIIWHQDLDSNRTEGMYSQNLEPMREEKNTRGDTEEENERNRMEGIYSEMIEPIAEGTRIAASTRKIHVKWNPKNLPEVTDKQLLNHFAFFGNLVHFDHPLNTMKQKGGKGRKERENSVMEKLPFCNVIFSRLEEAQSCLDFAVHKLEMGAVLKVESGIYYNGEETIHEIKQHQNTLEEMCEILQHQNMFEAEDSGDRMGKEDDVMVEENGQDRMEGIYSEMTEPRREEKSMRGAVEERGDVEEANGRNRVEVIHSEGISSKRTKPTEESIMQPTRKLHVKWNPKNIREVNDKQLLNYFASFGDLIHFDRTVDRKKKKVPFCSVIFGKLEEAQGCLDLAEHKLQMGAVLKVKFSNYNKGEEEMYNVIHPQNTLVEAEDSGDQDDEEDDGDYMVEENDCYRMEGSYSQMREPIREERKRGATTRKVHVKWDPTNLREVTDKHLVKHFAFFGDLVDFDRPIDRRNRKVPFCTFIFSKLEEAQSCLDLAVHKLKMGAVFRVKSSPYEEGEEELSEIMLNQIVESGDQMSDEEEENDEKEDEDKALPADIETRLRNGEEIVISSSEDHKEVVKKKWAGKYEADEESAEEEKVVVFPPTGLFFQSGLTSRHSISTYSKA